MYLIKEEYYNAHKNLHQTPQFNLSSFWLCPG